MTGPGWTTDALCAVEAACREKYGRYTGYVEPMVAPQARATTLRLVPRSEAGA